MKIKTVILTISLVFNLALTVLLAYNILNGYPEARYGKYGVLKEAVDVGRFGEKQKMFSLPKGLTVKDVSASGADWFEPNRFKIIVTSDREDLVDFSIDPRSSSTSAHSEFYSASK